ncbi:hypothetical protein [Oribacterium sp. WCC10]|uniref:hypothetical protein n=1 Tax=Oribacterium sp. WCC10 TaxID=1855343 RepID=UPI0008F3528D|nr:hypothetical protein [Oribacterium sp. WCC10]SFG70923.1 hypothetical protein SAMN05216356_12072 [Oribacterium sp. WCC10]
MYRLASIGESNTGEGSLYRYLSSAISQTIIDSLDLYLASAMLLKDSEDENLIFWDDDYDIFWNEGFIKDGILRKWMSILGKADHCRVLVKNIGIDSYSEIKLEKVW